MSATTALALGTAVAGGLGVGSAVGVGLLSKRLDAVEAALARLGVEPGQMTGIIETIQTNISQLQSEVAQLRGEPAAISQLQATVSALLTAVNQLQAVDAQQNASINSLAQRVAVLEAEIRALPPGLGGRAR